MVLGIYGSGGMGKTVCDLVKRFFADKYDEIYFIDDITEKQTIYNTPVLAYTEFCEKISIEEAEIIIAVGEPEDKKELCKKVKQKGYIRPTLIHPGAEISQSSKIGDGVVILAGCSIGAESEIDDNVCINEQTVISHNCRIGADSQISAHVTVGGYTDIGHTSFIGMSATLRDAIRIGNRCIVGAGACVVKNVADDLVVYGNPAQNMKKNDTGRVWN